jgi:DNA primase
MFEIRSLETQFDMKDPQGKTSFFNETAQKLLRIEDDIERNNYIEAVAQMYNVSVQNLRKKVNQLAMRGTAIKEMPKPKSGVHRSQEKKNGFEMCQKLMLTWLTSYPKIFGEVAKYISPEDFTNPLYNKVAKMLYEQYEKGELNPARLLNHFTDSEEQKEVAAVFNARIPLESNEERKAALLDVIYRLKEDSIAHRTSNLAPTDMQGLFALMQSKKELENLREKKVQLHISFD